MDKWVLYTQPNYAHPKLTNLTPLSLTEAMTAFHANYWIKNDYLTILLEDIILSYFCVLVIALKVPK